MKHQNIVKTWFDNWEEGDFMNLPITEDFRHTSPYGIISGKNEYIKLVDANKEKFLGHRFEIHDELYKNKRACVRYTAFKANFKLDVTEWYVFSEGLIKEIIAYYNIEKKISEEDRLSMPS